jgi:hypothetical protein
MKVGGAVAEAVGEFLKLLIHANKGRVKQHVGELFRMMREEIPFTVEGELCDDSDSDEEERTPLRQAF